MTTRHAVAAVIALLFAILMPARAQACEPNSASKAAVVSYEFATDPTAAGELDVAYQDNYDFEADSPYCTVKPINGYEDVEGMLVQCELPA